MKSELVFSSNIPFSPDHSPDLTQENGQDKKRLSVLITMYLMLDLVLRDFPLLGLNNK